MKNNKGITLIALVITIIVLLILAGVSIAMLSGENGLLTKATESAEATKEANAKERLKIELIAIQAEELADGKQANLTSLDANKNQLNEKGIEVAESGTPRDVTLDGYTFKVKDDLTIEGDGTSTGGTGSSGNESQTGGSTGTTGEQIEFAGGTIPSAFSSGNGSESSPYLIENEVQLRFLAAIVNNGYNTYEGKYIKLNNDITLDSTKQWIPIGNLTTNFNGTFDGNGKTISGVYIENSLTFQGLFGVIGTSGMVKNTAVEGNIKAGASYAAGIAAQNSGTISRCVNKVTVSNKGNMYHMGGIAGVNLGTIEKSCNLANISGYDCVGGISTVNYGIIKECYNTGTIYSSYSCAGGIAGHNGDSGYTGYIYNCYNNASVTGSIWIGGIAGSMGYNSGRGYMYNSYTIMNTTIVQNSQNSSVTQNCYTTDANGKLAELNAGIDGAEGTDTEQPWVADTNNVNGGYPILSWQIEN